LIDSGIEVNAAVIRCEMATELKSDSCLDSRKLNGEIATKPKDWILHWWKCPGIGCTYI
jgi:hypothetical protein